ncbi:D-alanyl-D-alanine carboxypeptidase [bacterium]|nr:D-alanyl-D-alanine carboxypeptidase [bacterium]
MDEIPALALLEYRAMRRIACVGLLLVLLGLPVHAQETADSELTLKAYLIYDIDAETIVVVHNRQQQQPIASLTKLMTAVLACERLRFDGRYILNAEEREIFGVDTMRADKMLEMALVPSNNRVCKIIARYAAGDETSFAQAMNAKALELGMVNTHFANASGLPGGEQYSTMDDLLILARVAMLYPSIRRVVHLKQVELGGKTYDGTLKPLYDRHTGLLGGKTGYTRAAGRCLILYYNTNGRNYIVITLGSDGVQDGFRDAELVLKQNGLYAGEVGTWD